MMSMLSKLTMFDSKYVEPIHNDYIIRVMRLSWSIVLNISLLLNYLIIELF